MGESVKILCVDDEINVLRALRRLFMDEEYEMLDAASGEEALEMLQREENIRLVLSDYRMPGMNGVDFLKQVCEQWPRVMRIILSGYADTALVVAAINEGQVYKFIPKPWNDDELKITIAQALQVFELNLRNELLTAELQRKNEELSRLNANLEQIVDERTNDILFQNKVLEHAQNVLHRLPAAVLGIDPDGLIVQCNTKADNLLADHGETMSGKNISLLPTALRRFIDTIDSGKQRNFFTSIMIFNMPCLVNGLKIEAKGTKQGVVVMMLPRQELPDNWETDAPWRTDSE